MVLAGIDVSAKTLHVAVQQREGTVRHRVFDNTAAGHDNVGRFILGRSRTARVCVEATGLYSLDLCIRLSADPRIEVMVVNPRVARYFGHAQFNRSKDDTIDSDLLLAFVDRMAFEAWAPPAPEVLELRSIARRMGNLIAQAAQEKNRLHAAQASVTTPTCVLEDITANITHLATRALALEMRAEVLIQGRTELNRHYDLLRSVPGIARRGGVRILGELALLDPEMTDNQVVAHAGLDVRRCQSGTSINRRPRISKMGNARLRSSLYMVALTAVRCCPEVRAFHDRLAARGKPGRQPLVAVMRKLLVAIWNLFKTDMTFDARRFCGPVRTALAAA